LISALFAAGTTTLAEPFVSADHTERLMVALGLPLRRIGSVVAFDPGEWTREIPPLGSVTLPGSATIAAYLAAIAQRVPGSDITLDEVAINPTRSGVLDVIRQWGGAIAVRASGEAALREPIGEVRVQARRLRGGVLGAEELVRSQGEIAALLLLGVGAYRDVELLDLEAVAPAASSHWQALRELAGAFGLAVEPTAGGLRVAANGSGLRPARVDVRGSAELAIAATALALASPGESVLENAAEALASSHPGFRDSVQALGGEIELS
jgi:3-phosphoshikimate 1-carboxyvinyltransferase